MWFLAPLYILPFLFASRSEPAHLSLCSSESLGWTVGLICVGAIWLQLKTHHFLVGKSSRFYSTHRAVPEVAQLYRALHLSDDIEPLVENITGSELRVPHDFRGIYVWNIGGTTSLWIISQRAMQISPQTLVRTDQSLSEHPPLLNAFIVTPDTEGRYLLTPRAGIELERHPYFGGFLMLRVPAEVKGMRARAAVAVVSKG